MTAGELKTRGYYQGSNVSYNLKSWSTLATCTTSGPRSTPLGPGAADRKGAAACPRMVATCSPATPRGSRTRGLVDANGIDEINTALRRMERFWTEQIRYIY